MMNNAIILGVAIFCLLPRDNPSAQDDYQRWLEQQNRDFNQYVSEQDRAFADFLKKEWVVTTGQKGIPRQEAPKPTESPILKLAAKPQSSPDSLLRLSPVLVPPTPLPRPVQPAPVEMPAPPVLPNFKTLKVTFCQSEIVLTYDPTLKLSLSSPITKEVISDFWLQASRWDYRSFLEQLQHQGKQRRLNDWGYGLFVNHAAQALFPGSLAQAELFTWFLLLKSGYAAKIGYADERVALLLPFQETLFDVTYYTLDNQKYYLIPFNGKDNRTGSLSTYQGNYPEAKRALSLRLTDQPRLTENLASKTFQFSFRGGDYSATVKYNRSLMDYYRYYPTTDLEIYFKAPVNDETRASLTASLQPILQGKTEIEAVNLLLRFVQTGFHYEIDGQQFGREKCLFPEETLNYSGSDCEDRSVLFAYLVKSLLGLEVVGLDYPGHVATAVCFSTDLPGDFVVYQNRKYLICDPTYVNADAGMGMERFRGVQAKVIATL